MIERKEYLLKKDDITFKSRESYYIMRKTANDPNYSLHLNILNDIKILFRNKIKKMSYLYEDTSYIENPKLIFIKSFIAKYSDEFTYEYYMSLIYYLLNENVSKIDLMINLKQEYLVFLLYLFKISTQDNTLDYYIESSLYNLDKFIRKITAYLDVETSENRDYFFKNYFNYYLQNRKDL